jgi:FMN reductase
METQRPFIVGLGGSMDPRSTSLAALRVAMDGAAAGGAEVHTFAVHELALPMYVPGAPAPAAVLELCAAVERCHGMIWSSPLYHGSVSGSFKNALDWLQILGDQRIPYLHDKAIGLVCTAAGMQGLQGINTMEYIVRALRGLAIPFVSAVPRAHKVFDDDGAATDPAVTAQLTKLGSEVARIATQLANGSLHLPHLD